MKSSARLRNPSWEVPILGLVWLFLAWTTAKAQVRLFTTSDGLPSNTVTDIVQTTDGYLWIATPVGVSRFDGTRFDNFFARNIVGMRPDEIKGLLATRDGSLWLRTSNGPVRCRHGIFSPATAVGREPGKLVLCAGPKGGLFAGEAGGKLWSLDGSAGQAVGDVPDFPGASLQMILPEGDGSNAWWARASDGRIARLVIGIPPANTSDPAEKHPIAIAITATPSSVRIFTNSRVLEWTNGAWEPLALELNGGMIESAQWLPDGSAWVSIRTADGTTRLRRWEEGQWKAEGQIVKNKFRALEWTSTLGRIWTVTPEGGCIALQLDGSMMRLDEEEVVARRRIQSLFEAKDGTLWLGTVNDGLMQVRPALFQSLGLRQGLADSYVNPVCETRDGALWLGTFGRGLDRYVAGKVTHFDLGKNGTPGYLRSLLEDRAGRLWVGLTARGVLVSSNGSPFQEAFPNSLLNEGARVLFEDRQGGIWIGNSYGAYRWDGSSLRAFTDRASLGEADVRAIAETTDGSIWFGSLMRGLWRWRENEWKQIDQRHVQSLYSDADDVVWIGGKPDGLGCWHEDKLTWFTVDQGLPHGIVTYIAEDGYGYLWLGTYEGILRVSKAQLLSVARGDARHAFVERFDETDGLPVRECSSGYQPAGARLRDGRIAIATLGGLVLFDPAAFTKVPPAMQPQALVEGVSVDGDARTESMLLASAGQLELPPGRHNVAFRFVAPYPPAGNRVEVRYKLEGLEPDWVAAGASRTVEYRALTPGKYTFRVAASGPGGAWKEATQPVQLRFSAPLWEQPWVRWTAGPIAVGLLLAGWRQFATWKLRRRIAALERETALAQERSRIAQEIHDDLGATLTHISLLSQLDPAADSGIQASPQLREIYASARAATRAVDEIVWALNPRHDTLDSLVNYLIRFAEDFVSSAHLRCRLSLPANLPEVDVTSEVRHHLLLAVKEALHNAVQHAAAAEVRLRLEWDDRTFVFIVEDDGRGFNLEDVGAGDGNGITNLNRRLAAVGGTCVIHSVPGSGTQVRLCIPTPANSRVEQPSPASL